MMRTLALSAAAVLAAVSGTAQDWAVRKLEASPRHQEWAQVKSGDRTVHAFVVFPESKSKSTVVIVIHENRGLTDWVRTVADRLASEGYIAIAPDLLSGSAPGGGRTKDFANQDAAREAIGKLPPDQVTADLDAVAAHGLALPASNGKLAVGGFCWGGAQTFRYATNRKDLKAAFVFYGTSPADKDAYARIQAPVHGFYAGNDERVNATIAPAADAMKALGKRYEPVTYDGAGHGFMRAAEEPEASPANVKAHDDSWKRWLQLLKGL
jgi:carboxymethylenebutenolidase